MCIGLTMSRRFSPCPQRSIEPPNAAQRRRAIPSWRSLLNVEDEVYVAAVLGCTMGVMRHPLHGLRPENDPISSSTVAARQNCAWTKWCVRCAGSESQRRSLAASAGSKLPPRSSTTAGPLQAGETWQPDLVGTTVWQGAPAILARNMELPTVKASGEKPFVFAARFPNGAVAVGAQERTKPGRGWRMTPGAVTINVDDAPGPFGIFGEYEQLTLNFAKAPRGSASSHKISLVTSPSISRL